MRPTLTGALPTALLLAMLSAASADPGRMGRTAYHLIHPIMVAGIISA